MSEQGDLDHTSLQVRRAIDGDEASLEWVVERVSPLLTAQARERLGPVLRQRYDPEDIVQDAWIVALPRLAGLVREQRRVTPILLRFLGTTVLNRVNTLLQKHLRHQPSSGEALVDPVAAASDRAAETRGVVTRMSRSETYRRILGLVEELPDEERRIVLFRGVEQHSPEEVAVMLDLKPNTVTVKYRRALEKLRTRLPESVFDEMET